MASKIAPDLSTTFLPPSPHPTNFSTPHRHHHHHRPTPNFPPKAFYDLTPADFAHLAPLFVSVSNTNLDATFLQDRILRLPSHLQAHGLRRLSSLCSMHNHLAPAPVASLLGMLRAEIEGKLVRVWLPLVEQANISAFKVELVNIALHLSALWLGPEGFRAKYGMEPRLQSLSRSERGCAACVLTAVGLGGLGTLLAHSSIIIGGIEERWWPKSSRARWCESWVWTAAKDGQGEQAVDLMFKVARAMGDARLRAERGLGALDEGGFEIVSPADKKRKRTPPVPRRPKRISGGSGFVTDLKTDSEAESEVEEGSSSEGEVLLRPGPGRQPRITSSIYSRPTSTPPQLATPRPEESDQVDDILTLYRRSTIFPANFHPTYLLPFNVGKELPALPLTPPQSVIKRKPVPARATASLSHSLASAVTTSPALSSRPSIRRKPVPAPSTPPQYAAPEGPSTTVPARKPLPSEVWASLGSLRTVARKRRKLGE
ncbi:hypothetical protein B0A48_09932 [Cryoendolithus antarcticus]|uniref:Uncharacterized protein n=1 Tax=Cryoendolithus antarcticus TaxID=1507870 RepID=A0A1V8T342_9PEZI|nr:hypothetical protein B0A48_09932 [Cryoendolithus antarcticus]